MGSKKCACGCSCARSKKKTETIEFDLKPFLSASIKIFDSGNGTTNVPHRVLEWMAKVTSTKLEHLVLTCLVRNSLGYRRSWCETSHTFIANWAGLAAPNVKKAIDRLIEKKIIVITREGNLKHESAQYEIPLVKAYLEFLAQLDLLESQTENLSDTDESHLQSKQVENSTQNNCSSLIKTISNKETLNKRKKSLPLTDLPKGIADYFAGIKSPKKKAGEWEHFLFLKETFALGDINECLVELQSKGIPSSRAFCHSPMAYLAKAMSDMVAYARNAQEKLKSLEQRRLESAAQKETETQKNQQDEHDFLRKVLAFEKAFPSAEAQQDYVAAFSDKYPFFSPKGDALRNLVINEWNRNQQQYVNGGSHE